MASVSKRKKLLVGVSGGRDSMVLLDALQASGYKNLVVVHLDHTLRARSSAADARLVANEAKRRGLSLEHARARSADYAAKGKKSLELAARELRQAFFQECSRRSGARSLVLAHHADDQVETCLFNFLRGSGAAGLGGMKPVSQLGRLTVYRPLLAVSRSDISRYQKQHQVRFREDLSNAALQHTRNKIRHQVLPQIAEVMGEAFRAAILRTSEILRSEDEWMSTLVPEFGAELDCTQIREMHPALRSRTVLRWLRLGGVPEPGRLETQRVLSLLDPVGGPAKVSLPGDFQARRRAGVLFLESSRR
jgi:tRNA(Ile)-lysidine synthase